MIKIFSKKTIIGISVGAVIFAGTAASTISVLTTKKVVKDTSSQINSITRDKSDFVYDAVTDPNSINAIQYPEFVSEMNDINNHNKKIGGHTLNVIKLSGNRTNIDPITKEPIIVNYQKIIDDLAKDHAFINKSKEEVKAEYWKRLNNEFSRVNEKLYKTITDNGGSVTNEYEIEFRPSKGFYEISLFLAVPEHLNVFADSFISKINHNDQVSKILKANPELRRRMRLFGVVEFASPRHLQDFYFMVSGTNTPWDPKNKVPTSHNGPQLAKDFGFKKPNPSEDDLSYTFKNKKYIVIAQPEIDIKKAKLNVVFNFYYNGNYVARENYRGVAKNFESHTVRRVSLDVLAGDVKKAPTFTREEQRDIIAKAFNKDTGTLVEFFKMIKPSFGALLATLPELAKFITAMQDTIGHLLTVEKLSTENIDLILNAVEKSPLVSLSGLLSYLKVFKPSDISLSNLMSADAPLMQDLYQIFATVYVLEEASHVINPNGSAQKKGVLDDLIGAIVKTLG